MNCKNNNPNFHTRLLSRKLRNAEATGMRANRKPGTYPVNKKTTAHIINSSHAPFESSKFATETPNKSSITSWHKKMIKIANSKEIIMCTNVSDIIIL